MSASLINAYTVILILMIGYLFKRCKVLTMDHARRISSVVMYLTLPCAILGAASDVEFDVWMLFIIPIAAVVMVAMIMSGYAVNKKPQTRMFAMLNMGGFNIGNFVLPFMLSILTPKAFLALCLFDVVNAIFCFGGTYCLALWCNRKDFDGEKVSLRTILETLAKSVTSYCCIAAILISTLDITIPDAILMPIQTIGKANTFLCMLIIGVALNFAISFDQLKRISKTLLLRYGTAVLISAVLWFVLPYSADVKIVLMVIVLSPITSMAPITAMRSLPDMAEECADLNMIGIITSLILITLLNMGASLLGVV